MKCCLWFGSRLWAQKASIGGRVTAVPELAEVAIYARDLELATRGQRLKAVSFPNQRDWGATIVPRSISDLLRDLVGQRLHFSSEGKALHIRSTRARRPLIEFRLGMTGCFHHKAFADRKWRRHCFLLLEFENSQIFYSDPRRFGRVTLPQDADFSLGGYSGKRGFIIRKLATTPAGYMRRPRIAWLLGTGDQTGVGNYMANEALGRLGLSPFEVGESEVEAIALLRECAAVARQSYRHGGNSFGSGFYGLEGDEGRYAKFCKFYKNLKVPRLVFQGRPVFTHFSENVSNDGR